MSTAIRATGSQLPLIIAVLLVLGIRFVAAKMFCHRQVESLGQKDVRVDNYPELGDYILFSLEHWQVANRTTVRPTRWQMIQQAMPKKRVHPILNEEVVETKPCRYGIMSFFKNDNTVSRSLREYGEWAQVEIEFLRCLIAPKSTVLDIGAFIGTHTLAFAEKVGEGGKVYAFEPQPLFFQVLKKNIEQNALTNVSALNVALSDKIGRVNIFKADAQQAGNFAGTGILQSCSSGADVASRRALKVTTIDKLGIKRCALIKIDVDGMAFTSLKGARQSLHAARPIVFAECNSLEHGWPVVEFAAEEAYSAYVLNVLSYNPDTFRCSPTNSFGSAREVGLVLIPTDQFRTVEEQLDQAKSCPPLIPISCIDDL